MTVHERHALPRQYDQRLIQTDNFQMNTRHTFADDLDAGGAWILSLFPENHIQRFTSSFHLFRFPCQCLNMRVKRRNFLNKVFPPVPS